MKKTIVWAIALALLMTLAGCDPKDESQIPPDVTSTTSPQGSQPQQTTTGDPAPTDPEPEGFSFLAGSVSLEPGAVYDPSVLPEPDSVYSVPSCAFEGEDTVYSFGTYEVTTYGGTGTEVIYSIYLLDPNITTPEGLALGDDLTKVHQLYGTDGIVNGRELVYTRGQTLLVLILQDEVVISIEYRMA